METLLYLLKVSACLGIFYGFYHLFLRKLTFFTVNRFYLLATLLISLLIPFIEFQIQRSGHQPAQLAETSVYTGTAAEGQRPDKGQNVVTASQPGHTNTAREALSNWDWQKITIGTYWIVAAGMLLWFLGQVLSVLWHTRHIDQRIGELKIIYKAKGFTNCSFLNYVFVDQHNMTEIEISQVIKHESIHAMSSHSADKLVINLFKALLWFNPIIYLYDYAMEQVHEYEADKRTSTAVGNKVYASLLLTIAVKKNNPDLVHSFVKHPLKERIQMLFTKESKHTKKLIYVAALPIGAALACIFGIQVVYANIPEKTYSKVMDKVMGLVEKDNIDLEPAKTQNELKAEQELVQQQPADSLLMIDFYKADQFTEVIIDGKTYGKDILYKISPRCMSDYFLRKGQLIINTRNNEILYATELDRSNKRISNKAEAKQKFYVRYTLKNEDGSKYDIIRIKMNGRTPGGGSVSIKRGTELLFLVDGKRYHESVLKTITNEEYATGWGITLSSGIQSNAELVAKYGKKYDSMIELVRIVPPAQEPVNMPLTFSARDSTKYSEDKNIVYLYGGASLKHEYSTITADYIEYNAKELSGKAKGAIYSNSRSGAQHKFADSIHFDLGAGRFTSYDVK